MATLIAQSNRPAPVHTKSFTRYEPRPRHSSSRSRSSTLSNEIRSPAAYEAPDSDGLHHEQIGDVFEKPSTGEVPESPGVASILSRAATEPWPEGFDELPIELVGWTDRFIAELTSARIYPTPLSVDELSQIIQEFYTKADSHISTHLQALSSRQKRGGSPTPSVASRSSKASAMLRSQLSKDSLRGAEFYAGQQMLTAGEVSDKRRVRRLLEQRRVALEEAVERRVCEAIYEKLWRHKSTLDEVRDEKLRSKTASLALVGINLKELGVDMSTPINSDTTSAKLAVQVEEWISLARGALLKMDEAHSPLGKLQHLTSSHQSIVDLLTKVRQSSSSADEILPTLIYTLISAPPEGLNIISNLNFIQRFRAASKIDGEAAYCLTNLEAAITFLETVDLASLRSEEAIYTKPSKPLSRPSTPGAEKLDSLSPKSAELSLPVTTALTVAPSLDNSSNHAHPLQTSPDSRPSSKGHHRRSSSFFSGFKAADQSFRNIGETLDTSFSFLFGRLREQQAQGEANDATSPIVVPKTLDEARRLVSPKPLLDDDGNVSETSSYFERDETSTSPGLRRRDDPLLGLFSGRKTGRDSSVDSALSSPGSFRAAAPAPVPELKLAPASKSVSPPPPSPALESMRAFGSSLNPLNRLRGFGRSNANTPPPEPAAKEMKESPAATAQKPSSPGPEPALLDELLLVKEKERTKVEPPVIRFMELQDAGELKLAEIQDLLMDYQRLAAVLQGADLC